jgi:predicted HicB family RNase H-like nuclease
MSDTRRITLRLDADLHDRIQHRARAKGISANTWMALALADALQRSTGEQIVIREVIL